MMNGIGKVRDYRNRYAVSWFCGNFFTGVLLIALVIAFSFAFSSDNGE